MTEAYITAPQSARLQQEGAQAAPWPRIILIYLIGVFGMLVVSIAVPALGGIAAEFHPRSPAIIGWVMSIPALAAALASLLIGAMVDRIGDRPVMIAGAALVALAGAGVMMAGGLATLLAWRVVGGLGYVCMVVGAVAMILRLTQGRQRVAALTLWSTVIPASFIVSGLYGALVGPHVGWRMGFGVHAALVAMLGLMARLLLPAREGGARASRLDGLGAVLRSGGTYQLGLCFAAAAFVQTGLVATLPRLLGATTGVDEAVVHSFTLPAMAANIAGAALFGVAYGRGARAAVLGFGAVGLVLGCGAGLVLLRTGLAGAVLLDCGMMVGLGILVGMWALLPLVAPSPASMGATSGMVTQITLLGVLFGPPAAFASLGLGSRGLLAFFLVGGVLSLLGYPVWRRRAA
ncbi:putative MFS family arabinose efflux permease [Novosphingobium sp. SG751A]|uniref:MFS transporter n=1 Tax=Novosphingobium sp. SG751A TaxID=2587000 RepID=UPI001556D461|nr:putative MFS family arabinose efflux permease [Novosphingobium sp. SG751A]